MSNNLKGANTVVAILAFFCAALTFASVMLVVRRISSTPAEAVITAIPANPDGNDYKLKIVDGGIDTLEYSFPEKIRYRVGDKVEILVNRDHTSTWLSSDLNGRIVIMISLMIVSYAVTFTCWKNREALQKRINSKSISLGD